MREQKTLHLRRNRKVYYTYIIIDPVDMSRGYEAKLMILCKKHKCILYKFEEKFLIYRFVYGNKQSGFSYKRTEFHNSSQEVIKYLQRLIFAQTGYQVNLYKLSTSTSGIARKLVRYASEANVIASGASIILSPKSIMIKHARYRKFKNIVVVPPQHVKDYIKSDHMIEMTINSIIERLFPLMGIESNTILEDVVRSDLKTILVKRNQKIEEKRNLCHHKGNIRIEM